MLKKTDYLIVGLALVIILGFLVGGWKTYQMIQSENVPENTVIEETPLEEPEEEMVLIDEEAIVDEESEEIMETPGYSISDSLIAKGEEEVSDEEITEEEINSGEEIEDEVVFIEEQTISSEQGNYLVLAGTFRYMLNAENELKKIQQFGYTNAQIVKFNRSTFASVCVQRFDEELAAKELAKSITTKHQLEAYVHKKRSLKAN